MKLLLLRAGCGMTMGLQQPGAAAPQWLMGQAVLPGEGRGDSRCQPWACGCAGARRTESVSHTAARGGSTSQQSPDVVA